MDSRSLLPAGKQGSLDRANALFPSGNRCSRASLSQRGRRTLRAQVRDDVLEVARARARGRCPDQRAAMLTKNPGGKAVRVRATMPHRKRREALFLAVETGCCSPNPRKGGADWGPLNSERQLLPDRSDLL